MLVPALLLLAACIPLVLFGQQTDENYQTSLDYFQGEGVLEDWFKENFIDNEFEFLKDADFLQALIEVGRATGALGALIYFGWMGAKALAGEGQIEYLPMVKTAIFASLLLNWIGFTNALQVPFKAMESAMSQSFENSNTELNGLRLTRYKYQEQLNAAFYAKRAELKAKATEAATTNGNIIESIGAAIDQEMSALIAPIEEALDSLNNKIEMWVNSLIEEICLLILRLCVYLMFILKTIFLAFIIAIGPIALGISFFPGFEGAFTSWVSRFVNVSLYGVIAYIILNMCMALQIAAYKTEIDRYAQVIDSAGEVKNEALLFQISRSPASAAFDAVSLSYLIGGIAILCTPMLANMVVSSGGMTSQQFSGKMGTLVKAVATKGTSLLKKK